MALVIPGAVDQVNDVVKLMIADRPEQFEPLETRHALDELGPRLELLSRLDPDDPYLTVSEAAAWRLLERLASAEAGR